MWRVATGLLDASSPIQAQMIIISHAIVFICESGCENWIRAMTTCTETERIIVAEINGLALIYIVRLTWPGSPFYDFNLPTLLACFRCPV